MPRTARNGSIQPSVWWRCETLLLCPWVTCWRWTNDEMSCLGLDRCLRRHGVSNLRAILLPTFPYSPREEGAKTQ